VRRSRRVIYPGFRWFVLRVEGSFEHRAALVLEMYGQAGWVADYDLVKRIWVPQTTVQSQGLDGPMIFRRVSTLPGYLLIEAILTYDLYESLLQLRLPHVFGWLRTKGSWPSEIPFTEIQNLNRLEIYKLTPRVIPFDVGERVELPWLGVVGEVLAASTSHLILEIPMFNRKIPINVKRSAFSELVRVENSS
jgi:transcription antitermination factor NusG